MLYEFMQYAYVWHSSQFYVMLLMGLISGVLFSRHRKKKSGVILLNILIWIVIIYPLICSTSYLRYHQGVTTCKSQPDYVMVRGICYMPVNGYVPYNTRQINKEVGEAVKDTEKK